MKWILLIMLFASAQAGATVLKYTFNVLTQGPYDIPYVDYEYDLANMTLLVDPDLRQITSLTYKTKFFDIKFQGAADITRSLWRINDDGTGHYGVYSDIYGGMPDGGLIQMYLEVFMPLDGNPSYFLNKGADSQGFYFYSMLDSGPTYYGFWGEGGGDLVVVPEPTTLSLFAIGLAAIGIRRRLRGPGAHK